ncbi:hypothetical protein SAMN05428966_10734 [Massilia sp. PDC64]|nr:hypothetical protein [Massilia sp. PDC64]SDE11750.1 hypothetical protein SAMN05428966_10734 [Massilia sp. PDC64]
MREDMFKVIVERPRLVNSDGYSRDGRKFRNDENAPGRLGMKRGYVQWPKGLNENLAPLKRYLEQQVDRPWDRVYSDIRATIDARSTVKQHILQHIRDFVAIDTHWVEGKVVIRNRTWWQSKEVALEEADVGLFVHPRTGILLRNRHFVSWDRRKRHMREQAQAQEYLDRRDIDENRQLRRIDGIWYEVTLSQLPMPRVLANDIVYDACWDAVRREWVSRQHGDADTYAISKRQLGAQALKKYGLAV